MTTIRPLPTFDEIKHLAEELHVTFASRRDAFDLDKSEGWEIHGTYRKNQAGFNAAFSALVHLQEGERRDAQLRRSPRQRSGIGASGVLALSLLAALITYTIGTFAPQTRGITGPLTILCLILLIVSGCVLLFGRGQK